jgi:hypothetical protein
MILGVMGHQVWALYNSLVVKSESAIWAFALVGKDGFLCSVGMNLVMSELTCPMRTLYSGLNVLLLSMRVPR